MDSVNIIQICFNDINVKFGNSANPFQIPPAKKSESDDFSFDLQ